jgi:hypothetical protein
MDPRLEGPLDPLQSPLAESVSELLLFFVTFVGRSEVRQAVEAGVADGAEMRGMSVEVAETSESVEAHGGGKHESLALRLRA